MKKWVILSLVFLGVLVGVGLLLPERALGACGTFTHDPPSIVETSNEATFTMGPVVSGNTYKIEADCPDLFPPSEFSPELIPSGDVVTHTFQRTVAPCIFARGTHNVSLWRVGAHSPVCTDTYVVGSECTLEVRPSTNPSTEDTITVRGEAVSSEANHIFVSGKIDKRIRISVRPEATFDATIGTLDTSGWYEIEVVQVLHEGGPGHSVGCPVVDIFVYQAGGPTPTPGGGPIEYDPCAGAKGEARTKCENCISGVTLDGAEGTWTGLGCIPNEPEEFVAWVLSRAVMMGGGIAFLIMLWGGFQIITSSGDPQKLNAGKDTLVSAAVGLLFIIFSVFLLRIIGIEILALPGLNP